MHLGVSEFHVPSFNNCDLELLPGFLNHHLVWCKTPISFEVGIPNLVCGCILGWQKFTHYFWVPLTLTSDLASRSGIEFGTYLLYSLRSESQSRRMDEPLGGDMFCTFLA